MLKHVTIDGIRIHLNLDQDTLLINGYYTVHLNKTAKTELELFIDTCWEVKREEIIPATVAKIMKRYKSLSKEAAEKDLKKLIETINYFGKGQIPCHLVGLEKFGDSNVPQRMDLALSYKCNNFCSHCYLKENTSAKPISTGDWKKIIDKLWKIGIPQVAFTGGECTLQEDLVELVKYSEQMITGIITNGTRLTPQLSKQLKDANLDWIQITLESPNPVTHGMMQGRTKAFDETVEGIKNAVAAGLSVSVNATLTQKNYRDLPDLIRFAKSLGVKFVATNALINSGRGSEVKGTEEIKEEMLGEILHNAKEVAKVEGIEFNWFLPTCYKHFDPVKEGFGQRCCSACGVNMLIEPDGTVLPCQSWTDIKLGNILTTPWEQIWDSDIAKKIRGHKMAPLECEGCDQFSVCGGGCPLSYLNDKEKKL